MQAIILAGGFGTRLRPLTISKPKPMIDVANAPIMEYVVELLKKYNFKDIISLLYYQPEIVQNYFTDGGKFGVKMSYVKTRSDLGTAGAVGECRKKITDTFIAISGDIICDFDLAKAVSFHKKRKALATIVLTGVPDPLQYGIVITKKDGRIASFLEKPTWGEVFSDTINTGIYIFEPEIFKHIPEGSEMDFSRNLFPELLKNGQMLFGATAEGYWKDVGNIDEYLNGHLDAMRGKIKINIRSKEKKMLNGFPVWTGKNTKIPEKIKLEGPVIFGENVVVGDYTTLGDSCFGNNSRIGKYSKIIKSVVQEGVSLGHHCDLKETIVGFRTVIEEKVKTFPGAVIGNECEIGAGATIQARIKIWPKKFIEPDAFVNSSVVWADRFSRTLFGAHGINGLANIEITPEFATRIGAALGAKMGKDAYIITSRDANQVSRMIKRALIAGLISTGVRVGDLRTMPIPVVRYESGREGGSGGIHVRMSPFDARVIDILFFDETGSEISPARQKAVEQAFFKEDMHRAAPEEIGEIFIPPMATQYYKEGFIKCIDSKIIKKRKNKIVCDYAFSPSSLIFPEILGKLNIETVSLNGVIQPLKTCKSLDEFNDSLNTISKVVTSLGTDMGVMLDAGGEKVFLTDGKGRHIHSQKALLTVLTLVGRTSGGGGKKVCLPVNITMEAKKIAAEYSLEVITVATSPRHIMNASKNEGVVFAGDGKGGFIFPEFQPAFDAMYAICKIIEMCAKLDVNFTEIAEHLAEPDIVSRPVHCPWGKKGFLMRKLIEELPKSGTEMIDGIKLTSRDSWILFLPDANKARFNIFCEAKTKKEAIALIDKYSITVKKWLE